MATSFNDARSIILEKAHTLGVERIPLTEANGRVLAETLLAPWDLPLWDNSAMDGFAVRSEDCVGIPCTLKSSGYVPAGSVASDRVRPGCAIRIMTGAPLPPGADAVVPVEEVVENGDTLTITSAVEARQHIRFKGEDVALGTPFLEAGTRLRPSEINLLAAFGQVFVPVYRRPRVAVLSTGDELVELGEALAPGRIINSNSLSLAAAIREAGGEPMLLGIARDEESSLREKLAQGLKADILITSAGVSAGDRDLVREVLDEFGVRQLFWKIDMKPGRPTAFGVKDECLVFSLPGNPVSTLVTFEFLVRPAILKVLGWREVIKPCVKATLKGPTKKKEGRRQFMRVVLVQEGETLFAVSSGNQHTGMLTTMVRAEGFAILPEACDKLEGGEDVDVHLFD